MQIQDLPIFPSDYRRLVAKEAELPLVNRFVEQNPALSEAQFALIARPALNRFTEVGTGPIRKVFTEAGAFDGDAFAVSGTNLYRVSSVDGTAVDLGAISTDADGDVSMAATSPIGTTVPSYLFIAEGQVLWVYTDNGHARAQLQVTGTIVDGDEVEFNGTHYQWTSGDVDSGTPDGTSANPWLVALALDNGASLNNLFLAINANGELGVDYSSGISVADAFVEALSVGNDDLFVQAIEAGSVPNAYTSTVVTGAGLTFGSATFTGGGTDQLSQVTVPEDAGAVSVAHINSFVIVVPVQLDSLGTVGRFYWIEPGERTVDPLNFATAERSPDRINQVITYSDMFWLFGDTTTEPWVTTGSSDFPMQRFQGILFDRGSWEGTAVKIRDSMIVVDEEGGVFVINNGQRRVSNPAIEERIRTAIRAQASQV